MEGYNMIYLFAMRFNIPVIIFSVMLEHSNHFLRFNQYFGELVCLAPGYNILSQIGMLYHQAPVNLYDVYHQILIQL